MTQDNFTVCWEFVFHIFFRQTKSRDAKILILNNWTQHCDSSADLIQIVFKKAKREVSWRVILENSH